MTLHYTLYYISNHHIIILRLSEMQDSMGRSPRHTYLATKGERQCLALHSC